MNKIKVTFREQSKAVIAETSIESDEMTKEEILKENRNLFNEATAYARLKTLEKMK